MSGFFDRWAPYQLGLAIVGFGGFLFTLDVPLLRLAEADKWTMLFVRGMFLGAAITAWWLVFMRGRGDKTPFINGWPGLVVAISNTIANICFLIAITMTTAANVVFILALNPVFCAILARIFLKERIHFWTAVSIGLCLLGVGIIYKDGIQFGTIIGDILACIAAMCTAVALVVIRHSKKNVIPSLAFGSFASALVALPFAAPLALGASSYFWLGLNGLLIIPLGSALMALGPKYLPAPEVAIFFLLETVLVPIWIFMIFAELPTRDAAIGGLIIIVTLLAHSYWRLKSSTRRRVMSHAA